MKNKNLKIVSSISNDSKINKKVKANSTYSKCPNDSIKIYKNKNNLSATATANPPKKTKQIYNILIIEQKKSINNKKYEKIFSKIEYGQNTFKNLKINFVIKFLLYIL
jgi:hypothetical protein